MDYLRRFDRLRKGMQKLQLDIFIIDDLVNVLYLTGLELSLGKIVVTQSEAFLLVDGRYYESCRKRSPITTKLVSNANNHSLLELLKEQRGEFQTIGFDAETTSYRLFEEYDALAKKIPPFTLKPTANLVRELRSIKDAEEIEILQKASDLGCAGFHHVRSMLKEGITELELAVELEIFWRRQGGKKLAFDPIIAFGPHSSMPHHRATNRALKQGEPVLIDIGVNLDNYHSDMTRVVFFGAPAPELEKIYNIVQEAQDSALRKCKPGVLIGDVDLAARQWITDRGYGEFFTHGLGHGVGLEIHELPVVRSTEPYKNVKLEPGMVITIEPGVYLPDIGGVRLEDTIVITPDGYDNMTRKSFSECSL